MSVSAWRPRTYLLILFACACFAFSPTTRAVSPSPDGGYAGGNTAEGTDALFSLTSGLYNTAVGQDALYANTTGSRNTGTGTNALRFNTTGSYDTATGVNALYYNTNGFYNTATGVQALFSNTSGAGNTATGYVALIRNTTGGYNTATGENALFGNVVGSYNTADGANALYSNTEGYENTANGHYTLYHNTVGYFNTAVGASALFNNTTGIYNTAVGANALASNRAGNTNVAVGSSAAESLSTGGNNVAIGFGALAGLQSGNNNIAIGLNAGSGFTSSGDNNIDIGNPGVSGDSGIIRIGTKGTETNTYIAGINGVTVAGGVGVVVDTNGHLGTVVSSERFKKDIHTMGDASDGLLSLQPVTFRYKQELDSRGIPQFGLVAEDVEKVNPDLVARDEHGKPYTVRYEAVNMMLLNEFLKEHRKGQEQDATISQLKSGLAQQQEEIKALAATLKEQASQIRKVSTQLAVGQPAPQVAASNE